MTRVDLGFPLAYDWLCLKQRGGGLKPFFEDNRLRRVAIYGFGELGRALLYELRDAGVEVCFGVDRSQKAVEGLTVYKADVERLPETDAVLVTTMGNYWRLVELLEPKTEAPILAIEDVVDYCCEQMGGPWR